jgi:ATP-dependent RNA helicase DeaD
MESFSGLGLAESLASALASFGFQGPTPVQAQAVPVILSRRDAILESETGTGKTFAYLAPALQMVSVLERRQAGEPGVLIAAPTQELAVQIGREAEKLAKAAGLSARVVVLLGGTPLEKQAAKLKEKPDIVVGTIGRLADLVALRRLRTLSLKLLVLDEADRLFAPESEALARALLESVPQSCVRVLASATMPDRVRREAGPYLRDAADISPGGEGVLSKSIEHWCFYCDGRKRLDFVRRFEAAVGPERCLLFMSSAARIEKAAAALAKLGLPIESIHAGMDKETRRVALERFAEGKVRYLLTSDLGARGLDIPGVSHVLSLDLPEEPTVYTHRAGRTGRAGATGVSVALADGVELSRASKIAVRGGFVFRCKELERGAVAEPSSEEFFARANAAEDERRAHKAARIADGERRGPRGHREQNVRGGSTAGGGAGGPRRAPSGQQRRSLPDSAASAAGEGRIAPRMSAPPRGRSAPGDDAAPRPGSPRLVRASDARRAVPEKAAPSHSMPPRDEGAVPDKRPSYKGRAETRDRDAVRGRGAPDSRRTMSPRERRPMQDRPADSSRGSIRRAEEGAPRRPPAARRGPPAGKRGDAPRTAGPRGRGPGGSDGRKR